MASLPRRPALRVSPPAMPVAFARHSRDGGFAILGPDRRFPLAMAAGPIAGAVPGGPPLDVFPHAVLVPVPTVIPPVPAVRLARRA
ncbi:hypothetical protein ACH4MA_26490 [Streptomyces roseolus]|uniref:hypothetical protein n=1 Tax=Streptomyces roseolus TaxID=67358 RepID=UPI00378B13E9